MLCRELSQCFKDQAGSHAMQDGAAVILSAAIFTHVHRCAALPSRILSQRLFVLFARSSRSLLFTMYTRIR
jgi:hypothetical protein